jgi:hypothetical protein
MAENVLITIQVPQTTPNQEQHEVDKVQHH